MSRGVKLLLGAATLWPVLYLGLFMGYWLSMMLGLFSGNARPPMPPTDSAFAVLFALHCFTMACVVGLLVFYVSNLFRNPRVRPELRTLWAVVLFLGSVVAMPVYWSLYIWGEPGPEPSKLP